MSHETDFAHPQLHLVCIKDNAAVLAPLKEILETPVAVCGCFFIGLSSAIDEDIICDAQNTSWAFQRVIQMPLEYLGRSGETERQTNLSVPSIGGCEGREHAGFKNEDTVPVPRLEVNCREYSCF